jgi:hypothetical protein
MKKIVHAYIYRPHRSIFSGHKKDKAKCSIVQCENSDNCGLYKRGECSWLAVLDWQKCSYGSYSEEEGFTLRSSKYYSWIGDRESKYSNCGTLKSHTEMMATIGDFIFLPYAHMTMNESVFFEASGGAFKKSCFLPKEKFTIDVIVSICLFRPQALFGGEIKAYQAESVPKFLRDLSEQYPDLFKEVCEKCERANVIKASFSNIGRKAILNTLNPNVGTFIDIHDGHWKWDGEYLTSEDSHASFMLVNKFSEIRMKPMENQEVEVTDEKQVNKSTIFKS